MSIPGVLGTPTHVSDMWSPDKEHSFIGPFPPNRGVVKVWLKKVAVGFFSRTLDEDGCCVVTKDAADAAVFEIKSVGKHVSLEVLNWDSGESAYLVLTEDTDYFTFDPAVTALTAGALWDPPDEGRLKFVNFPMSATDMAKRLFYGKVALAIEEGDVITCVFENSFKDQIVKLTFSQSL
ncbi:hypothetical protein FRB90_006682 [Tulasnella sp. 427]|nr:hypothetical protein FRB90_006682 [Tulasnella sp. 427]